MFKLEQIMQVSSSEFYDLILSSIMADYKQSVNSEEKIFLKEGFIYTKDIESNGKTYSSSIEIMKLIENELYEALIKSEDTEMLIRYKIKEIDSNSIIVTYEEEIISTTIRQPRGLTAWLMKKQKTTVIKTRLNMMEEQIKMDNES